MDLGGGGKQRKLWSDHHSRNCFTQIAGENRCKRGKEISLMKITFAQFSSIAVLVSQKWMTEWDNFRSQRNPGRFMKLTWKTEFLLVRNNCGHMNFNYYLPFFGNRLCLPMTKLWLLLSTASVFTGCVIAKYPLFEERIKIKDEIKAKRERKMARGDSMNRRIWNINKGYHV